MWKKWTALLGLAALLAACAHPVTGEEQAIHVWNGGIWNSVLGYNGPSNGMVDGGPTR